MATSFVCLFGFLTSLLVDHSLAINKRPIIGVLAQETDKSPHGDTYIPASYFKWLEAGGCRTVPISVLFPGGGVDLFKSEYGKAAKIIYEFALKANDNGDYFPLWGTCLGFQLLTALTSGQNLLSTVDAENIMMPLNLEPGYNNSRLFGNLPHDVFKIITSENVTANFHHYGLLPKTYLQYSVLNKFYRVLSKNQDTNGKVFISTIEARQYPFYGTQWHPEVNSYLWREDYKINHNPDATRIAQYITNFIVGEARKSNHRFPDFDTEVKSLINNYHPYFSADETLEEIYYFNYTKSDRNVENFKQINF